MISISGLKKIYGSATVVDIDALNISRGERFGLVGNNGAGKTTLFRMILDLIRPTSGEVLINGKSVAGNDDWKNYVGSFLDENFLIPYLTPDEYFSFVGKLHGYTPADLSLFHSTWGELFNNEITGKKKYIRDLSKGNLKKVGIAAAFIGNPEIIILDEPFENLDPTSQIRLKQLLVQKCREQNITCIVSSHDLNHVTEVCERVTIMENGRIHKDISEGDKTLSLLEEYFKR